MNKNNYKETIYNTPFIPQRADPFVTYQEGYYYFTASVPEYDNIVIRRSKTLDGLKEAKEIIVWTRHLSGVMSIHIWAPEIHFINGKWYIYYAAGDKDDIWAIRPYVLECQGINPMEDNWIELGQMREIDQFSFNDFSLDMTVFENVGQWYCIWAEKVNLGKKISNLYIAKMNKPNELSTEQVLLTSPDYDWERVDFWVNEGPAVITHGNKIFVTYSASATGECYCMGMLSASKDADLIDPKVWRKERYPVLKTDKEKGIYGPGHNSFVKGVEDYNVMFYHARPYDEIIGNPLYDPNRHTYRMKIKWNKDDTPIFDIEENY